MKKLLICLFLIVSVLGINSLKGNEVSAADYYPMSCSLYEVSYINDDGSLSKVECFNDFNSAKNKMKELGGDHVVRHPNSYSPTKIIAMNSGRAYSYPGRGNGATLNIYEDIDDRSIYTKRTYVSHYYEMYYYDTSRVLNSGGLGMIHVNLNGFDGYTDLEYCDLVPDKYLRNGIALWLGGRNPYYSEDPYRIILSYNRWYIEQNGNYKDLVFKFYRSYPKSNSLNALEETVYVGRAPSFMRDGANYYSKDSINFYSDTNETNLVGSEYNYYQFLPLRSKTDISASAFDTFLRNVNKPNSVLHNKGQVFIDAQNTYGCNALLVYAMACHESAYGTSNYARNRNNLFGWEAYDASPSSAYYFSSIDSSVREHMGINLRGYLDITDSRFFNSSLGNKAAGFNVKYASDPYWGLEIAGLAYRIDKSANNHNGQLTDFGKYDLALISKVDASVKAEANNNSKTLYTTEYGGGYQKHFITIRLGENNSYTKIQSTNALDSNKNIKTHRNPPTTGSLNPISTYDYDLSVGYILSNELTPLNYTSAPVPGEYKYNIDTFKFNGDLIHVEGSAYVENINVDNNNKITSTLKIQNNNDSYSFPLTTNGINFSGDINLSEVPLGRYQFDIYTEFSNTKDYNDAFTIDGYENLEAKIINNKLYRFEKGNGKTLLYVEDIKDNNIKAMTTVDSIKLTGNKLDVGGIGLIRGFASDNKDNITYKLVLVNLNDNNDRYEFNADVLDNEGFKLNDNINYRYSIYSGSLDLTDVPYGEYGLYLNIKNNQIEVNEPLANSRVENRLLVSNVDRVIYNVLSANEIKYYRYELKITNTPLNYLNINKPSARSSLVSIDDLSISNNKLNISGQAMMYYLDYKNSDLDYEIYLVNTSKSYTNKNIGNTKCEIDFSKIMNSKNNLDCICFNGSVDISNLRSGEYQIFMTVKNGNYYDIIPVTNRGNREFIGNDNYSFNTNKTTYQLSLIVK